MTCWWIGCNHVSDGLVKINPSKRLVLELVSFILLLITWCFTIPGIVLLLDQNLGALLLEGKIHSWLEGRAPKKRTRWLTLSVMQIRNLSASSRLQATPSLCRSASSTPSGLPSSSDSTSSIAGSTSLVARDPSPRALNGLTARIVTTVVRSAPLLTLSACSITWSTGQPSSSILCASSWASTSTSASPSSCSPSPRLSSATSTLRTLSSVVSLSAVSSSSLSGGIPRRSRESSESRGDRD